MASINGVLSPQSHSDSAAASITSSAKRKRDDSIESHNHTNGIGGLQSSTGQTTKETQAVIRDLLDILKSHDISSSILTRPLPDQTSSTEPQAKRQKAEGSAEPTSSIMTRSSSHAYSSIDDVLADIDSSVSDVMEKMQLPTGAARNQYMPVPNAQVDMSLKVSAFKKRAHELVQRAKAAMEKQTATGPNGSMNATSSMTNGGLGSNAFTQINASSGDNKLVLTLYGNAPGPKQLFSSLQIPTKLRGQEQNMVQSLREAGLPNGITTTQIVPIQSSGLVDDRKQVPTLGGLFPTPSTIPPLQPPKPSKVSTTRSSTVGWYQPAAADAPPRNSSYFKQSISTGQWLDYSNSSLSLASRRKQRDRTMSMSLSATKAPQFEVEPAESEAFKLEALFRSAYSGFAPTKDDAAAIAPEGLMNRMWWQRIGEKSFERLVENSSMVGEVLKTDSEETDAASFIDDVNEIDILQEAVDHWAEEAIDPSLVPLEAGIDKSTEEREIEEILQEISELLETLNSYQRIRHLSLNQSSRPVGLLSAPDTSSIGTPSKPSESEQATYEILKSQLLLMIASLPPYAVAKLDSAKLADLSISSKIEIRMDDYKGVMEEDETSARAKAAALNTASSGTRAAPPTSLHRSSSSTLYGNQYTASRPASATSHQYYGSSQTPMRSPSNNVQRPPATAPVPYQSQRPASSTPYRPGSYAGPSYSHQAARPAQQQYGPSSSPQYLHTPSAQSYNRPLGQGYQNAPQSVPQPPRYPSQPSYPPQNSSSQNGGDYRYGNSVNATHQGSPQKPLYSPQPSSTQPAALTSYSTPTTSATQEHRSYVQGQTPMMNGSTSQTPQPQQPGLTNYSTYLTTEQQDRIVERQRAQLAQQQSTQHQARNVAQGGGLGSPSKGQVNGGGSAVAAGL